jgi:hypothetical protein
VTGDRADLERLAAEAAALPRGPAKLAVWEQAVALADALADPDAGFRYRVEMMSAALGVGRGDLLAPAFAWCLAKHDERPDRFPPGELLWRYRWAVSELSNYPQVSKAQLDGMIADMGRRYKAFGLSLRPVHMLRVVCGVEVWGRRETAKALADWRRSPRDLFADDPVTERAFVVVHLADTRQDRRAVRAGLDLLARGVADAYNRPKVHWALILPLLRLGRLDEAAACHRAAVRHAAANPRYASRLGTHVRFLAVTGNLDAGVRLFRTAVNHAVGWADPWSLFRLWDQSALLFERLAEAGRAEVRMRLPAAFGPYRSNGRYDPAALAGWLRAEAERLAALFDARSGTGYAPDLLRDHRRLRRRLCDYPL